MLSGGAPGGAVGGGVRAGWRRRTPGEASALPHSAASVASPMLTQWRSVSARSGRSAARWRAHSSVTLSCPSRLSVRSMASLSSPCRSSSRSWRHRRRSSCCSAGNAAASSPPCNRRGRRRSAPADAARRHSRHTRRAERRSAGSRSRSNTRPTTSEGRQRQSPGRGSSCGGGASEAAWREQAPAPEQKGLSVEGDAVCQSRRRAGGDSAPVRGGGRAAKGVVGLPLPARPAERSRADRSSILCRGCSSARVIFAARSSPVSCLHGQLARCTLHRERLGKALEMQGRRVQTSSGP